MIKIIKGDLLEAKEDIIAHQVNCMGKMNSGVAKQIREEYVDVFKAYEKFVNKHVELGQSRTDLLGRIQIVFTDKGRVVANLFGQLHYGYDGKQYTNTKALFHAFKTLREVAEKTGKSVALPYKIGCYRGGADWDEVENLLLIAFDGYEVTLYKKHEG